jgi:hypothetical protein
MTALVAFGTISIHESGPSASSQDKPEPVAALLQSRCAAAERNAAWLLFEFMRSPALRQIDRIGPALRRMFEAEVALAGDKGDRLTIAERYHRLVYRFAMSEKNASDNGQFPEDDHLSRFRYYLSDADIEMVKARRAGGITTVLERDSLTAKPDLRTRTALLDLLPVLIAYWNSSQEPDSGSVPLPKDVLDSIKTRFEPVPAPNRDEELFKVLNLRTEAASGALCLWCQVVQAGAKGGSLDRLYNSLHLRLKSELELSDRPSDHVKAHERALVIAREFENICETRYKVGQISEADRDLSRFHRLDHQIQWLRAKARLDAESKKPK